ncbi:hypothetical protein F2Q69_00017075 [Brassica cretica]|uniref:Uncharacterized protein n=1 Tax=Brassica cretica TaxID=69181 RepID=A0A8S9QYS6_BRACR|nr:hypothetical protein F2Q69_00017075 [Brassica cretica]
MFCNDSILSPVTSARQSPSVLLEALETEPSLTPEIVPPPPPRPEPRSTSSPPIPDEDESGPRRSAGKSPGRAVKRGFSPASFRACGTRAAAILHTFRAWISRATTTHRVPSPSLILVSRRPFSAAGDSAGDSATRPSRLGESTRIRSTGWVPCLQRVRIKLYLFEVLYPGPWTSGLVSHTSLSDFPVTHPSFALSDAAKRGTKRTRTVRVRADAREVVDDQGATGGVQAEGVQPAAPPFDKAALMQMVQQAATQAAQAAIQQVTQEAARVAAQEAARVAAQEVARQLAAGQQIPQQQIPLQQIPPQHIPPQVPVQGVPEQQLPQGLQQPPLPPRSPLPV